MSRRNKQSTDQEAPQEGLSETPPAKREPEAVKLRLKQNAFVRGELTPGGTVCEFTPDDAAKRLKATQLWERI